MLTAKGMEQTLTELRRLGQMLYERLFTPVGQAQGCSCTKPPRFCTRSPMKACLPPWRVRPAGAARACTAGSNLSIPCLPNWKAKEFLEDDEVKALIRCMDKSLFSEYRDLLIMMVMLDSGTRLGETLSIELSQMNLVTKSLHLPADKTKGRKARTFFFSARTASEIRRWLEFKDRYCDSDYIFPVKHSGAIVRRAP